MHVCMVCISGMYSFNGVKNGQFSISISRSGYVSTTIRVTVSNGDIAAGTFGDVARPAPTLFFFAPQSVRRPRLMPQVNPGPRYRCDKRD